MDEPRTMTKDDIRKEWALDPALNKQQLQFDVRFKRGPETMAVIHGMPRSFDSLRVGDVTEKIAETEQYLERLTGLRVHIRTAEEA